MQKITQIVFIDNGVNGDRVGTAGTPINPNLGALANNRGPTQTHALLPGSPAIDTGNSAIAPTTDQRNLPRPSGSSVDIGAVEVQPIVSITAPDNSASESPIAPGTFRVSRSDSTIGNLTVNLAIDPSSTAVAADYTLSSAFPVTIPNGQSFVDVTLTPVDHTIPELAETLRLNMANGNYAIAPAASNATVTIAANDAISYAIALANPATGSLTECNSGTKPVSFTVTRSGTAVASTVDYAIAGTATNGADDNNINSAGANTATGTIAFAANETSKTISLDVLGDTLVEPDETITVTLSNPNLTAAPEALR
ncbi:MAG: choice-of-anchor Q domain-containing protein [Microcoleus sp.]